jgi:type IV pilus assembly protein PilC
MPVYSYKATTAEGATVEGVAEAKDKFDLARNMRTEGKNLLTATEKSSRGWNMDKINAMLSRVVLREKIDMTKNLATMIEAGVSVARGLQILLKQTKNPKLIQIYRSLSDDIQKGTPLSSALEKYDSDFPPVMTAMIRAGEESGSLVDSLTVVGSQMEKTYVLRKKIKGAMIYPAVVLVVMIIVGVLMMLFVVPGLASTFKDANMELPPLTAAVISISEFIQFHGIIALLIVMVIVGAMVLFKRTPFGAKSIDYVSTRVPVFGNLVKEYNAALITRTLASLIAAGVDIVRAITITRDVAENVFYKASLTYAEDNIQKGVPLSKTFVDHPELYPVMVGDMMEVGEETGRLSDMLKKIAAFYEGEVDNATADLSKLIEPLLMVVIAAFIGLFAYAMITPMYGILNTI